MRFVLNSIVNNLSDDHANNYEQATVVSMNGVVLGNIEQVGDIDWFRINDVGQNGSLTIIVEGSPRPGLNRIIGNQLSM